MTMWLYLVCTDRRCFTKRFSHFDPIQHDSARMWMAPTAAGRTGEQKKIFFHRYCNFEKIIRKQSAVSPRGLTASGCNMESFTRAFGRRRKTKEETMAMVLSGKAAFHDSVGWSIPRKGAWGGQTSQVCFCTRTKIGFIFWPVLSPNAEKAKSSHVFSLVKLNSLGFKCPRNRFLTPATSQTPFGVTFYNLVSMLVAFLDFTFTSRNTNERHAEGVKGMSQVDPAMS